MAGTKVDLTGGEQVQGTLPAANGGTGATSLAGASIELSTNKNAANGYAGLNSSTLLATSQLGTGSATSTAVLTGNSTWQALTRAITPEVVTVSSATSLTISTTSSCWVFSGSSPTTWTLPAVSGNTGYHLLLENRGSAAITVISAGADHIWFQASVTTMTVAAGGSLHLVNDGTYWNALSNDMADNSVGTLAVANGGTGATTLTSGALIVGAGTSAVTTVSGGTAGRLLMDNGSTWAATVYPRIGSTTSSATPAIALPVDQFNITALATNITSMSSGISGTWADGFKLIIRIKDDGTPRTITWGASWRSVGAVLPTTTVASKMLYIGGIWNATDSIWDAVAVSQQA